MSDLTKLTIKQALLGLKDKKFSASELTKAYIANIEKNRHLNAFVTDTFDLALQQAKKADENIAKGEMREMEGIPIANKDIFCTKNVRTTSGSKMLSNFVPHYESTVTQKLIDSGAISLGKLNMDEFAMGSSTITSFFGPTINPYKAKNSNEDLVPGGSSGGSSSAVAAYLCAGATGSDTGGSIRQPASFTNLVGVKPTYGRCSRYGMIAFASSLDQAGVFARDVADAALMQKIISGYDDKDSTCAKVEVPNFDALLNCDIKGKKIGIPKEYRVDGIEKEISDLWEDAIKKLKNCGAEIVDISLPHTQYAPAVYYVLACAEASSNLARFDGIRYGYRTQEKNLSLEEMYKKTRSEAFGSEVKRRILIGTHVLSSGSYEAYYKKAIMVKKLIAKDFEKAFKQVDAIVTPSTPSAAFPINESQNMNAKDPIKMYLNDIFTIPINLAGLPALSLPFGFNEDNLPLGLQIISNNFDEQTMFNIAFALEKCLINNIRSNK